MTAQTNTNKKATVNAKPKRVQYYGQVGKEGQIKSIRSIYVRDHVALEDLVGLGKLFETLGKGEKISHILVTEQKVWPMPN
ncbi:hypothetical protein [Pediococcus pentosaceus]|uniref:hypothetical protein n=1 Tax=Pediococcus pentosaceus TaxID=1255 RepID=UPI003981B34A